MSQSSGCYDSDSAEPCPTDDTTDGHPYTARGSGLRRQAIQNWHRRPYRNSTEGEEGDVSDVGSRTTESEAEGWEPEAPGSAAPRAPGSCRLTGEDTEGCSWLGFWLFTLSPAVIRCCKVVYCKGTSGLKGRVTSVKVGAKSCWYRVLNRSKVSDRSRSCSC